QRAARGVREMTRELEVLVLERARRREEDEHKARGLFARGGDGNGEQRTVFRRRGEPAPLLSETIVVVHVAGSENASVGCGAGERKRRGGSEALQQRQLLAREGPTLSGRCDREHRSHALVCDQRNERGALRADRIDEPPVDGRGRCRIEYGEGSAFENRRRNARRLVLEVELDLLEPVELVTVVAKETAPRPASVRVDEDESGRLDTDGALDVGEADPGDRLGVVRLHE